MCRPAVFQAQPRVRAQPIPNPFVRWHHNDRFRSIVDKSYKTTMDEVTLSLEDLHYFSDSASRDFLRYEVLCWTAL